MLSLANGSKVSVPDELLQSQLQILRSDCEWVLNKKGSSDGFDAIVSLNSTHAKSLPDQLKKVEVHPSLVLTSQMDNELRFKYDDLTEENRAELLDLEKEVTKTILKKFPGSQVGVYAEIGDEKEGHKKNKIWIAVLKKGGKSPLLFHFSSGDKDQLAKRAIEKLSAVKPMNVFITRDLNENDGLKTALQNNGFDIKGKALIEHKGVEMKKLPVTGWIFFSNKRAVKYFFLQKPDIGKSKVAAISKLVADEIRKYGSRAEFIGGSDSSMVARQFNNVAGKARVLFPKGRGDGSIVQQHNRPETNIDIFVYETINNEKHKIPKSDVVVFTSPVNVLAYLQQNTLKNEKVIAYGDATFNTLRAKKVLTIFPTHSFDNIGIIRAIYAASV
ncbi:MAG: hypothetical protein HKN39_08290 [Flavobacteriales bacterium]|nr:hypothetical protein [Flavobacteriales bacterium]